jgi:hypothetical protein
MPIKPENRRRYPFNWRLISDRIRFDRAKGRCECEGECGLHRTTPGPRRCEEVHGQPAKWAKGRVVLTVAHLDHTPEHCANDNLKAMCQRCHLRYDREHHSRNSAATRKVKSDVARASESAPCWARELNNVAAWGVYLSTTLYAR